jgi:murein DD-endopeptidase MepM/ murein hydrolase activator NlpD
VIGMPKRARQLLALTCATMLLPSALAAAGQRKKTPRVAKVRARTVAPVAPAATPAAQRGTRGIAEEHVHVRRGDTFVGLLIARGVEPAEARRWARAASGTFDLRDIRPKRGLSLRFDRATQSLETVRYEIDDHSHLLLERVPDGIRAERGGLPYITELKGVGGVIARGLHEDATEAGLPLPIVSELADIFGWDLDLDNDLRPGDEFRVLYENTWQAGAARSEPGHVVGAEIVTNGTTLTAVFFEDADGRGSYYRPNGEPVSREFLRYPVEFTEITSQFSLLRKHPILRVRRPHLGVDFAAPIGTPVRAVSSGTVAYSGWLAGMGRCVRLDHMRDITSAYAHLSRIATGVREGAAVEKGQVIGYVGASGLATGPHLHFEMHREGSYVDPLALTEQADARLEPTARRLFDRVQAAITRQLSTLPLDGNPTTVSRIDTGSRKE